MYQNDNFVPYEISADFADGRSIAHLINLCLSQEVIGAEVGVFKALTSCYLLQQCPKIKTYYAVDSYQPYVDYIKESYDNTPAMEMGVKEIDLVKQLAFHNIKFSGFQEKVIFLQKDSNEALQDIKDESLDFIFLDSFLSLEQLNEDLKKWYPKVKNGGLFSGHDWNCNIVKHAVINFRSTYNIVNNFSASDRTWAWFK